MVWPGANKEASPPGRHQEQASKQASKQRCIFSPVRSVQLVQFSTRAYAPGRSNMLCF